MAPCSQAGLSPVAHSHAAKAVLHADVLMFRLQMQMAAGEITMVTSTLTMARVIMEVHLCFRLPACSATWACFSKTCMVTISMPYNLYHNDK